MSHHDDHYPSRKVDEPTTIERQEPVVWGSADDGPLTQSQLDDFAALGMLQLHDTFTTDEVGEMLDEVRRMADDADLKRDADMIRDPETDELRSIFDCHEHSKVIDEAIRDERVAGAAAQILGSDVYLHQTRVNDKPGYGGSGFEWHSDFETWHTEDGMPTPRCLSASILLTDNHTQNGPLILIPGSQDTFVATVGETPREHWKLSLKEQTVGIPDGAIIEDLYRRHGLHVGTGRAGSMILFDSNTLHASNGNVTPDPRSNVFAVFNSVENALVEPYAAPMRRPEFLGRRDFTPVEIHR